jgi:heme-degrading monooxygenase HmoA
MAILVTLKVPADSDKLVQYTKDNPDALTDIVEKAKTYGVISHRFYASGGEVLVVDEWPDEDSFQAFFATTSAEIQEAMAAAAASAPPEVTFWTKLDTGDEI